MTRTGGLGDRRLSTWDAVAQSMAIGPIYSAAIYGALVAGTAGGVSPAIVVIAAVGALALAWVTAAYARRFAGPGSVYEYIGGVLGQRAGVAASIGYGYALLFLGPPFLIPAGLLFQTFARQHLGLDPGWWVGGVGAMAIVSALQYLGISLSVRAQLALTALSALPIVVLIFAVVVGGGAHGNTLAVFNPGDRTHGDVFPAVLFAITLFVGFECAAALGAETADPHRAIPRALLGAVALTGIWFIVVIYAGTIGFGPASVAAKWGNDPDGLATLARHYVGGGDATLIELGVLFDMVAAWMAFTNSFARLAYALARDGVAPSALMRTSRRGVPWVANLTWIAVTVAMLITTTLVRPDERFTMLTIFVLPGLLAVQGTYAVIALSAVRLLVRGWRWAIALLAAAVPLLGIYGTLHPFPNGPARWGIWLTCAGVAACLTWFAHLVSRRRPALANRAGAGALVSAEQDE